MSFYVEDAGALVACEATRGPWDARHQHGGPGAGLLARALEAEIGPGLRVMRLTVEFLRPLLVGARFQVTSMTSRPGRKVRAASAALLCEGVEVARASALAIRVAPVELPPLAALTTTLPEPEVSAPFVFPFFSDAVGYQLAMEARLARGRFGEGSMALWMRMRVPLVAGEEPSPLVRVAVAADSGNGVSVAVDPKRWSFINPDLSLHLRRPLEGEWVCLDATTTLAADGTGVAETLLVNPRGPIGRSLQSLVVEAR